MEYSNYAMSKEGDTMRNIFLQQDVMLDSNYESKRQLGKEFKSDCIGNKNANSDIEYMAPLFALKGKNRLSIISYVDGLSIKDYPTPISFLKKHFFVGVAVVKTSGTSIDEVIKAERLGTFNFEIGKWNEEKSFNFKVGDKICCIPRTDSLYTWEQTQVPNAGKIDFWMVPYEDVKKQLYPDVISKEYKVKEDGKEKTLTVGKTSENEFIETFKAHKDKDITVVKQLLPYLKYLKKRHKNSVYTARLDGEYEYKNAKKDIEKANSDLFTVLRDYHAKADDFVVAKVLKGGTDKNRLYGIIEKLQ
jgi:hypothetical protein